MKLYNVAVEVDRCDYGTLVVAEDEIQAERLWQEWYHNLNSDNCDEGENAWEWLYEETGGPIITEYEFPSATEAKALDGTGGTRW